MFYCRAMKPLLPSILALLTLVTLAADARADLPRPGQEACAGKQPGATCQYEGKSGTCASRTCMRATPTGTTSFACVLCEKSSQDGGAASADGGASKEDPGSCAMSAGPRAAGPWLLGGLFAAITLLYRRRRV